MPKIFKVGDRVRRDGACREFRADVSGRTGTVVRSLNYGNIVVDWDDKDSLSDNNMNGEWTACYFTLLEPGNFDELFNYIKARV